MSSGRGLGIRVELELRLQIVFGGWEGRGAYTHPDAPG